MERRLAARFAAAFGDGGAAEPIAGADEPSVLQYYPAFSPDGLWIAYNKAVEQLGPSCPASSQGYSGTYDNCKAEVFIVPSNGGTAILIKPCYLLAIQSGKCLKRYADLPEFYAGSDVRRWR